MSTDTKKRGIVDPWKVVSPLKEPPPPKAPEKGEKVNLADVDMDADIRPSQRCVFRGKHSSIEVMGKDVYSENDGLKNLVRCLYDIFTLCDDGKELLDEQNIGFQYGTHHHALPGEEVPSAKLKTTPDYAPSSIVVFREQTIDDGLLRLVRLLRKVQRRPGSTGEDILKKWGVTPMLR